MSLLRFWSAHRAELAMLTGQHIVLVVISTGIAAAVGIPCGIAAARRPRVGRAILTIASIAQTIPSLALLGFLLPLPFIGGIGPRTALVALSIYALLPILRTTVTGIRGVDPAALEAGIAVGMTRRQLLWFVELPLAMPSIVAGLRVATVIGVGTATIAAAIGAGGLGEYIFRGLSMVDSTTILAGAIPAAALALAADGALALVAKLAQRGGELTVLVPIAAVLVVLAVLAGTAASSTLGTVPVVVGSKNFTEQVILGEILAQSLEADGIAVTRKLNLGGTFVCDRGLRTGDLDVYVEYTGTAVTAVFHQDVPHESMAALDRARQLYADIGVTTLAPLGFNNTFAILVRDDDARRIGLRTIDDLRKTADRWTPGFGYEFLQREDGYPGLLKAYGLTFSRAPRAMDLSLIYRALAERQVDVVAGDRTSALIDAFHLAVLDDNHHYFPPYDAVPVARSATVLKRPEVARAINRLAGKISDDDMRRLNAAVDVDHRDVQAVAREFLVTRLAQPHS